MASTSSTPEGKNWDVFICFRGKDVREDFLPDLYKELTESSIGINPFLDDKLPTGKDIENNLLQEIDDSLISLVIFSQHFPDSSFCLNEIVRIRNCRKKSNQLVIPVFYKVITDEVQELAEELKPDSERSLPVSSFRKKFLELALKYDEEIKKEWLEALVEISDIKGHDSHTFKTDFRLIKEIVNDVRKHLCEMPIANSNNDSLIGIGSAVKILKSLLVNESDINDEWAIGIWGLPGVGKTFLADKVYNDTKDDFDSGCFFEHVKEERKKHSISVIRDKIIEKLLGMAEGKIISNIGSPYQISDAIKRRLKAKKVLIVLDDVEDSKDLKQLAVEYGLYKKGSRMIITSRDKNVLKNVCSQKNIYKLKELLDRDALRLFSLYAFEKNHPIEEFLGLSKEAVSYCQGLPLALRVVGSNLRHEDLDGWDIELKKLKAIPDKEILSVLGTSCDGLEINQLKMFLDIACFFRGECKDRVERIFEGCDFFPKSGKSGISSLINKSLIFISSANKVEMHDLIQQMGQAIVFEQCQQQPGGRSRIWNYKDGYDVLTNDTGTEQVEGILVQPSPWQKMTPLHVRKLAFTKMCNLRIIKFSIDSVCGRVYLPEGLEFLPKKLRYLCWLDYPLTSLPLDPENLVEVFLGRSHIEKLWDQIKKPIENLKYMDVSYSEDLISIPDLAKIPNLEVLNLEGCRSLVNIPLTPNPSSKLKVLICQSCDQLEVPESLCSLLSLQELYLFENNLERLPANINYLSKLRILSLFKCYRLKCLPTLPKSLKYLNVGGCISLKSASSSFLSSEGDGESCYVNFANCISLDRDVNRKIVEDVFKMHLVNQGVNLCIMGFKVPASMKFKEDASTLSFSLEEHNKLTGLSFSVVLKSDYGVGKYTYIGCNAWFIDEFGEYFKFTFDWDNPKYFVSEGSSHMLNWYKPFNVEKSFTEATFLFYSPQSYHYGTESVQFLNHKQSLPLSIDELRPIYACGVHPMYGTSIRGA